jgi:uncharacterized protein (TIGR03382 family)
MLTALFAAVALAGPPQTSQTDLPTVPTGFEPQGELPIINGKVEDGFPAAVGIGAGGFTLCSASVITPRLLLTAAHCSADLPVELVVAFGEAYFGTEAISPDHSVGFIDARVHPDYIPLSNGGQNLGQYDIAVIELSADSPVEPVWPRLDPLDPDADVGERIWSVGFGLDENGASGTKKSAKLTVDDIDDMFIISESETNRNNANICSGDSGGPQYFELEDGSLEQWAVHSWGDTNCVFNSGSTRTDVAADWLLEQILQTHGTTDRCEIEGRYQDGVCDTFCDEEDLDCANPADLLAAPPDSESAAGGCSTAPGLVGWAPLLLLGLFRRRRA